MTERENPALSLGPIEKGPLLEVMRGFSMDLTDAQIAKDLGTDIVAIRGYVSHIKDVYGADGRDGLVIAARAGFANGQLRQKFNWEDVQFLLSEPDLWKVWEQTMEGFSVPATAKNLDMEISRVRPSRHKITVKLKTGRIGAVVVGLRVRQVLEKAQSDS